MKVFSESFQTDASSNLLEYTDWLGLLLPVFALVLSSYKQRDDLKLSVSLAQGCTGLLHIDQKGPLKIFAHFKPPA